MPAYAVLGAQWGDEGKGKVIDFLAKDADIVARFAGGNNAGHTVINDLGRFSFHLVPCGVFWPQTVNVIGNGVVVDPDVLIDEFDGLGRHGFNFEERLVLSERAHLIMPYHVALDNLAEKGRGRHALGTTGKGIGPAYSDKALRNGIRAADLLDLDSLYPRLEKVSKYSNDIIEKIYGADPLPLDWLFEKCKAWGERLIGVIGPGEKIVSDALESGKNVVLEGAQGVLLDLDHGTYPYVTSSNPTIGGACVGLGINPQHISSITGVFKAYTTRVGTGPFPTELFDSTGDNIRDLAQEFGTTTGRPRRVGWFDGVAARYSTRINGYTSAVLTRLDVLDGFETVKICTGYELDGEFIDEFPGGIAALERCKPVLEDCRGWDSPTASVSRLEDLPSEARSYIDKIQELIACPIDIISTGPHREETIMSSSVL